MLCVYYIKHVLCLNINYITLHVNLIHMHAQDCTSKLEKFSDRLVYAILPMLW